MEDIVLTEEQQKAIDLVLEGKNVFVTSEAGAGKSLVIRKIKELYDETDKIVALTSTTGISALNIGGRTLHSWGGIGLAKQDKHRLLLKVKSTPTRAKWKVTDILIIDEISMMSCDLFEKIEYIARGVRNVDEPFGGMQVILFGDFYQLPPIISEPREDRKIYCFESDIWSKVIEHTVVLTKIWRQTDEKYKSILTRIRVGDTTKEDIETLRSRLVESYKNSIKLYPKNILVVKENDIYFNRIYEEEKTFNAKFTGQEELIEDLRCQLEQKRCIKVVLKRTARVMLVVNLDQDNNLINGSMGTIVDFFEGYPKVLFDNGEERIIDRYEWNLEDNINNEKYTAKATQVPLILAYAITIHKSQGQTLDSAIISLRECFGHHQIYVALSRVKSLEGLQLLSFDPRKITVDSKVKEFYDNLI